jgi:DNA-binding winged helix-turn-helix (wHTH) protein/energy-coupling factor transporter ATP-binding protein EcfA2
LRLTPKALSVLCRLAERPGEVVTKQELFTAVWPNTAVSDSALTATIQELRRVLRDDPRRPRYIETFHRRGFRLLGPVAETEVRRYRNPRSSEDEGRKFGGAPARDIGLCLGREAALQRLHDWLAAARAGQRQIVFIGGEAGIGKSTLIETFLGGLRHQPEIGPKRDADARAVWIAQGQCIENHVVSEGYLPVLEALGRLCRGTDGERPTDLLSQHAPSWLVQLNGLLERGDLEALQRKVHPAAGERMLREIAEGLEALTSERAMVLVLEDIHWSDYSTLALITSVAQRCEPARLLVIGTYRPLELTLRDHPLRGIKQELQVHGHCEEVELEPLTEANVTAYLALRLSGGQVSPSLARVVWQRTEGNPLFMVNMVDYLLARGVLVEGSEGWKLEGDRKALALAIPDSTRQLIDRHFDRLGTEEQRLLEAASVAGTEFTVPAVVAAF